MTIKEFLITNTLTAVETLNEYNLIINLICDEGVYGIDVNTSNIPEGTLITRRYDFSINNNILSVGDIWVNTETTNML